MPPAQMIEYIVRTSVTPLFISWRRHNYGYESINDDNSMVSGGNDSSLLFRLLMKASLIALTTSAAAVIPCFGIVSFIDLCLYQVCLYYDRR